MNRKQPAKLEARGRRILDAVSRLGRASGSKVTSYLDDSPNDSAMRALMLFVAVMMISGVISVLRPVSMAADAAADKDSPDRAGSIVRGTDETLKIRFHGTVVDEDGKPVLNPKLTLTLRSTDHTETELTSPEIDSNEFVFWLPARGLNWYGLSLEARRNDDSDELAYQFISRNDIRPAAIDGVNLTLRRPTASTEIMVTDHGQPIAGASVKANMT